MVKETQTLVCMVCGSPVEHRTFMAKEMMFGSRDPFRYFECTGCGTLQLTSVPGDLGKYYPQAYYSLSAPTGPKLWLQRRWAEVSYGGRGLIGSMISGVLGKHAGIEAVARAKVPKNARILDVGCCSGDLLLMLEHLGFSNLCGVDPFLQETILYSERLRVLKASLPEVTGKFDVIMFNHSLEHVPNPQEALKEVLRLLSANGRLIVRLPIAGTFAWRTYGANWVALDPPRHIFVPTLRGMRMMSGTIGFTETSVTFESDEFMFWGSEQYSHDIPLNDPRSQSAGLLRRVFPSRRIREFRNRARVLNQAMDSDAACFIYSKTTD